MLTKSEIFKRKKEREELYYEEESKLIKDGGTHKINSTKDMTKDNYESRPKHVVKCPRFVECPVDYKCRAYSGSLLECQNCPLAVTDNICKKRYGLHSEKNLEGFYGEHRESVIANE